jgi:hypothetical protein
MSKQRDNANPRLACFDDVMNDIEMSTKRRDPYWQARSNQSHMPPNHRTYDTKPNQTNGRIFLESQEFTSYLSNEPGLLRLLHTNSASGNARSKLPILSPLIT